MQTTRERVVTSLAELAAESDGSGFGAMLQAMFSFGFDSAIAAAVPPDDEGADRMLEEFAQIALCLRSPARRELVPFDPSAVELVDVAPLALAPELLDDSDEAGAAAAELELVDQAHAAEHGVDLPPAVPYVDPA